MLERHGFSRAFIYNPPPDPPASTGDSALRFLFLVTQSLESPGGGGRFLPLAQALVRRGHAVTMLLLHHDLERCTQREREVGGVTVRYVGQMHVRKRGSQKHYFPAWQLPLIAGRATVQLTAAALRERCDLVVVCKVQPMNTLAAWAVQARHRTPILLESDDWETLNNRFQNRFQQRVVGWIERAAARRAAGISANTRFIADQYERLGFPRDRIRIVPNSADPGRGTPPDAAWLAERRAALGLVGKLVAVYVGSLSLHNHALDLLLDAFAAVASRYPDSRLLMVGGGEDFEALQARAEALGIAPQLIFTGRLPADEAPRYYCLGDFSVAPMWDSPTARSSLSIKLAESLYAGVPVLTTAVGDYAERVGDAGIAVPPTVAAFAEGLALLFGDPERRCALRAAAEAARERYSWDGTVETFLQLVER